jgi:hypothetical protein
MNSVKNFLNRELYRLMHLKSASDLIILYFRVFQAVTIFLFLSFALTIFGAMGISGLGMVLTTFISSVLNIATAEAGLRTSQNNQSITIAIGILLASTHLFSTQFPLSLFGFYACLNPASQKRYLRNSPPWVKELLSRLKMDWIE